MSLLLSTHKHTPNGDRLKSSFPRRPSRHPAETHRGGCVPIAITWHMPINMAEAGCRLDHKKPGKHPFSNARTAAARGWPCLTRPIRA